MTIQSLGTAGEPTPPLSDKLEGVIPPATQTCLINAPAPNPLCAECSAKDTLNRCEAVVEFMACHTTSGDDNGIDPTSPDVQWGHQLILDMLRDALSYASWQAGKDWAELQRLRQQAPRGES